MKSLITLVTATACALVGILLLKAASIKQLKSLKGYFLFKGLILTTLGILAIIGSVIWILAEVLKLLA